MDGATEDLDARNAEVAALLARTRKQIAESRNLVESARLRMAETDRLLSAQGLTRDQVLAMNFTREQKLAVNEELRRRGLPALEEDDSAYDFKAATDELREELPVDNGAHVSDDSLAERNRKFGTFMQPFRI